MPIFLSASLLCSFRNLPFFVEKIADWWNMQTQMLRWKHPFLYFHYATLQYILHQDLHSLCFLSFTYNRHIKNCNGSLCFFMFNIIQTTSGCWNSRSWELPDSKHPYLYLRWCHIIIHSIRCKYRKQYLLYIHPQTSHIRCPQQDITVRLGSLALGQQ